MEQTEVKQMEKLGRARDDLVAAHPDLVGQIDDGLLVTLAGGCKLAENPHGGAATFWEVRTPHLYRVRLEGVPLRWSCSCPQGATFGPLTGDFFGHPGRVCKHVAAVATCLMAAELPGRPANLLALVERAVQAGVGNHGENIRSLPMGNGVKLVRLEDGEVGSLRLRLGRVDSGDLAWITGHPDGSGSWAMDPKAGTRYGEWVEQITNLKKDLEREEVTQK